MVNLLKQYSAKLIPVVIFSLLTAFFIWRALTLGAIIHIIFASVYGIVTLFALIGKLKGRYQSNLLNVGISLFFLDLVFAQLNIQEVGSELAKANWWLLIPSLLILMVHLVVRIWRWQWLLKPMGDIPFGPAFRAGMIGIGGNMVLPARAGEFLRAYAIGRSQNISKMGSFATVVVERIFDGLTILLVLLGLIILEVRDPRLQQMGLIGAGFYILAMLGIIFFIFQRTWFEKLIARLLPNQLGETLLRLMSGFASGLESLRDIRQLGMVILLSIITWALIPLSFWPVLQAFEYHTPLPFFATWLMMPMLALGLTIPGAPGGVGQFEWFGMLTLTITFQIIDAPLVTAEQQAVAAAAVLLLHISQSLPEALLGLWAFFAEGLTTQDLQMGREI